MKKIFLFSILFLFPISVFSENLPLPLLNLPPGFSISIFADAIPGARSLTLGKNGTVFVGSKDKGNVYAVIPDEKNKTRVLIIAAGLDTPNGVAFHDGALYVAEKSRILKFDNIESNLLHPPKPIIINSQLPDKSHHGWRYIKFGPDNKLYIGIGAPCNNCLNDDKRFATIMRMDSDGKNFEVYAKGVRNTVGFDWDPLTKQLWFTDNSRDWMGDEIPPDELNIAPVANMNFGFPYCHGKNILDPWYGKGYSCNEFISPVLELPAHVAALGMVFYTGKMFPEKFRNQIFIAEHGSWNRSSKTGYQVIFVTRDKNNVIGSIPFVTGWLNNGEVWGRPVDVLVLRDGSLLISDDYANVIYRVMYHQYHQ